MYIDMQILKQTVLKINFFKVEIILNDDFELFPM